MIHSFAHVMTLLAVTVHAVFGCCWHHGHASECCGGAGTGTATVLAGPGCDHDHDDEPDSLAHDCHRHAHPCSEHGDGSDEPREHEHHDHEPCEESSCSYSLTVAPKIELVGPLVGWLTDPDSRPFSLLAATVPGGSGTRTVGLSRGAPGICAHLQVWLL
ncbi:hypothetical protein [Maioricimonas sp. JC845]|uniref:hypothetical protein n=1 Tax=Maioricimonas sp. JC845 TaxID=3232138 RepID=UPI00345825EE